MESQIFRITFDSKIGKTIHPSHDGTSLITPLCPHIHTGTDVRGLKWLKNIHWFKLDLCVWVCVCAVLGWWVEQEDWAGFWPPMGAAERVQQCQLTKTTAMCVTVQGTSPKRSTNKLFFIQPAQPSNIDYKYSYGCKIWISTWMFL